MTCESDSEPGILSWPSLDGMEWVRHCFTTRRFQGDGLKRGEMCRLLLAARFPSARAAVYGSQVHGRGVAVIGKGKRGIAEIEGVDALVTSEHETCLFAFAADCPLVYIVDARRKVVALAHSGRSGTEAGMICAAVSAMERSHETEPSDCVALISPSIGPCCYDMDLWSRIEGDLRAAGISEISNPRICTACNVGLFHSYRRDKGRCGRMLGGIMISS